MTLNGAPVAFNENIRNSTQSGRQFRFRALSPELLAGARLIKSPTPDLIDGGVGSNINIETAGGLDGDPFLSMGVGGGVEARTGRFNPELAIAGRVVSADGDRGLVAGVSLEEGGGRYDRFQIMRYGETTVGGQRLVMPDDIRTTVEREARRRSSAFLGADWRVSPRLVLDFASLASRFDNAIREDRLVYELGERLAALGAVVGLNQGIVTAGRVADGRIHNNTEISDQSHLNLFTSLGAEMQLGVWRLTPRFSASSARSVLDTPLERFSAQSPVGVAYAFDINAAAGLRRAARLTTDFDLLDPSQLTLAQLNVRAVASRDDDKTLTFDAHRPLDVTWRGLRLSAVSLGGQISDRSRDYQRRDRRAAPREAAGDIAGHYGAIAPADVFSNLVEMRSAPWVLIDFDRMRAAFLVPGERTDVVFRPGDVSPTGADRQNSYFVGEQVAAAYARLDFHGSAAGRPLFGNLGARLVRTRTHADGARLESVNGVAQVLPVSFDGEHQVLLPSINVGVDIADDAVLRLAASRSITRPSLSDLRASTVPASVLVAAIHDRGQAAIDEPEVGVIFSGVGGNPALTPYLSTNLDLSYEVTRPRTSFSIAVFHKTIEDFVQASAAPEVLTFETRDGRAVQAEVLMSRPRNIGRAVVDGMEAGLHYRIGGGLGVWANVTWVDSRIGGGDALTGVSDLSWSVSPYLERGPLALHLSWSWRSPFRSEADLQGGGVSDFMVGAAGYLDAQVNYDVTPRVRLMLSGSNLTATRDVAYEGSKTRLLQLGSAGRRFTLSLRWNW